MVEVPVRCASALKEWATVLEAMARGEQMVLIRKGGLIEPGKGFELAAQAFVFYPTFEHQAVQYLREPYRAYFDEAAARRAPEGQVRFDLVGVAVSSRLIEDPAVIDRVRAFHVYNEAFVRQRLKWQPEQPLSLVTVRVFRLPAPRTLPALPRYAGCTSWVDLDSPIPLEGVHPVQDEAVFQERITALNALLPTPH